MANTLLRGVSCSVLVLLIPGLATCSGNDDKDGAPGPSTSGGLVLDDSPFPGAVAGEERIALATDPGLPNSVARRIVANAPLPGEGLGAVFGVYAENGVVGRYTWVLKPQSVLGGPDGGVKEQGIGFPAQPRPRIAPQVEAAVQKAKPDQLIPVIARLKDGFTSALSHVDYANFASFDAVQSDHAAKLEGLIAARQVEADEKQKGLIGWLAAKGVPASGFWLVNAVSGKVPAQLIPQLAERAEVESIELDAELSLTDATHWDGENLKLTTGLNAGHYVNNGYDGGRYNPVNAQYLSIAVMDFNFNTGHPVFLDWGGGPSRIRSTWTCNVNPCVTGVPGAGDVHGSRCASAAAGDAMDNQISGTEAFRRDRTGVAEEAELIFISTGAIQDTIRGLQKAVALKADVVSESFGGSDGVCDGFNSGWEGAVYDAHQAGVLVVGSAGNDGHTGNCTLTGLSEVPSQFVVGGLADPGSGSYASDDIWTGSSRGGINVTIGGVQYNQAFSGVDVLIPATWYYSAYTGTGYLLGDGGTSLAAPQAAGAALLFKDFLIAAGFSSQAAVPGVLFTNMLAMTDRAGSAITYRTSGFDRDWGGGRFQERYYAPPDNYGSYRMETAWYTISNGQHVQHHVGGYGNEPSDIQIFKTYAVFFERDGADVADIDVTVKDLDCGTGSIGLGYDWSRDNKSMVALSSALSAGKALCVDLYGYHVPAGETRTVVLVAYYSAQTSMR